MFARAADRAVAVSIGAGRASETERALRVTRAPRPVARVVSSLLCGARRQPQWPTERQLPRGLRPFGELDAALRRSAPSRLCASRPRRACAPRLRPRAPLPPFPPLAASRSSRSGRRRLRRVCFCDVTSCAPATQRPSRSPDDPTVKRDVPTRRVAPLAPRPSFRLDDRRVAQIFYLFLD